MSLETRQDPMKLAEEIEEAMCLLFSFSPTFSQSGLDSLGIGEGIAEKRGGWC